MCGARRCILLFPPTSSNTVPNTCSLPFKATPNFPSALLASAQTARVQGPWQPPPGSGPVELRTPCLGGPSDAPARSWGPPSAHCQVQPPGPRLPGRATPPPAPSPPAGAAPLPAARPPPGPSGPAPALQPRIRWVLTRALPPGPPRPRVLNPLLGRPWKRVEGRRCPRSQHHV